MGCVVAWWWWCVYGGKHWLCVCVRVGVVAGGHTRILYVYWDYFLNTDIRSLTPVLSHCKATTPSLRQGRVAVGEIEDEAFEKLRRAS